MVQLDHDGGVGTNGMYVTLDALEVQRTMKAELTACVSSEGLSARLVRTTKESLTGCGEEN